MRFVLTNHAMKRFNQRVRPSFDCSAIDWLNAARTPQKRERIKFKRNSKGRTGDADIVVRKFGKYIFVAVYCRAKNDGEDVRLVKTFLTWEKFEGKICSFSGKVTE